MSAVFGADKFEDADDHENDLRSSAQIGQLKIVRQCRLPGLHRSVLYYTPGIESEKDPTILRLLDVQSSDEEFRVLKLCI